jgi:hypothetical protein
MFASNGEITEPLRSTHLRVLPFAFLHRSRLQPFLDQPEKTAVGNAMLDEPQEPFVR